MLYVQNNIIKMDSFELNKIIAAILMVALLVIGLGKVADSVFHVNKPEKPGYKLEVDDQSATVISQATEVVEKIDIAALMSQGDIESGEKIFKKCAACHSITKGGKNKIGPALYNVVGRKVGGVGDYKYSKALSEYGKAISVPPGFWWAQNYSAMSSLMVLCSHLYNEKDYVRDYDQYLMHKNIQE